MRHVVLVLGLFGACRSDDPAPSADPGRVTLHRLNRAEYNRAVRDLFATTQTPADSFPADDFGYGFSNIADVLSTSSAHLDLYAQAADSLLEEVSLDRTVPSATVLVEAESGTGAGVAWGTSRQLWTAGEVALAFDVAAAGPWELTLHASGENGARLAARLDGSELGAWDVPLDGSGLPVLPVDLASGPHVLTLWLENPGEAGAPDLPTLSLDRAALVGPIGVPAPPGPGRALIYTCDPAVLGEAPCAEQIVRGFTRRAWRRPITEPEFDRLIALYAASRNSGGDWEEGVALSLKGALLAPQFVFRPEIDPLPDSTLPRPLTDWELASRLSFFLWSSIPDDALLDAAERGELRDPAALEGQVRRMLADPKADALVETLGVEWLYLQAVDASTPDAETFPVYNTSLRESMKTELHLFTAGILLQDRPMTELVTATSTWVDPALAAHYGIEAPAPSGFAPAQIPGRPGIMARSGWLTAVSYPTRTSPVLRGKWVLENLMCEAPPPPPPGVVGSLPADQMDTGLTASIREQFEQHRADPACAGCHLPMDGIGFALENFDGIGGWREIDEYGNPIDATGTLPGGIVFDGADELATVLATDPRLTGCMVQKVFTFALARPPRVEDLGYLEEIEAAFVSDGGTFRALATAIVQSEPFRYRLPAGSEETP